MTEALPEHAGWLRQLITAGRFDSANLRSIAHGLEACSVFRVTCGCFCELGVLFMGVLIIILLLGLCFRTLVFPNVV